MESESPQRAGFWLAGRFTPRQIDWIVVGAALLLSGPPLAHAALRAHESVVVALAALPFGTIPLLWRRGHPGPVLAVVCAAFAVSALSITREAIGAGVLFGVFAAALYGDRLARIVVGALSVGAMAAAFTTVVVTGEPGNLGHLAGTAFGSGAAWVFGDRTRVHRAYLAQLEERAARLEREREEHARQAADEERGRIARELHDVVAHNVSVIAVQAGAARATSNGDPEQATQAFGLIERTARSTLSELRTLLGVLRKQEHEPPALGPQPTLARLDALVIRGREAGLRVEARVEGEVGDLPAVVDLSAYRIVQEALTNAIKHAPGAKVELLVRRGARDLDIVVTDDGPGVPERAADGQGMPERAADGQGIIGMRERAALVGGELHAGPSPTGGFRVEAHLPVAEAEAGATGEGPIAITDPPGTEQP
ncbi:MAG: sensor histidine kinase [Actinomycetota bacterium]